MTSPTEQFKVPAGFRLGATTCGIKQSGSPDLALIHAPEGVSAAAVFTKNRLCAAPVIVGREHLAMSQGRIHAVIVNAGNANCATGDPGLDAARKSCEAVAEALGIQAAQVVPSSTGVIGVPFPTEKLIAGVGCVDRGGWRFGCSCGELCARDHDYGYASEAGNGDD